MTGPKLCQRHFVGSDTNAVLAERKPQSGPPEALARAACAGRLRCEPPHIASAERQLAAELRRADLPAFDEHAHPARAHLEHPGSVGGAEPIGAFRPGQSHGLHLPIIARDRIVGNTLRLELGDDAEFLPDAE